MSNPNPGLDEANALQVRINKVSAALAAVTPDNEKARETALREVKQAEAKIQRLQERVSEIRTLIHNDYIAHRAIANAKALSLEGQLTVLTALRDTALRSAASGGTQACSLGGRTGGIGALLT